MLHDLVFGFEHEADAETDRSALQVSVISDCSCVMIRVTRDRIGLRVASSQVISRTGAIDSYKIGPSIAMVLFQSRRVIGHWATVSAVTGWEQAR